MQNATTTYADFAESCGDGGRLAATVWPGASAAEAVAASLRECRNALILRVTTARGETIRGLGPCGLAA